MKYSLRNKYPGSESKNPRANHNRKRMYCRSIKLKDIVVYNRSTKGQRFEIKRSFYHTVYPVWYCIYDGFSILRENEPRVNVAALYRRRPQLSVQLIKRAQFRKIFFLPPLKLLTSLRCTKRSFFSAMRSRIVLFFLFFIFFLYLRVMQVASLP